MNDFTRGYMRGYKDAQKEALNREAMDSSPNGEAQPEQRSVSEQQEPVAWLLEFLDEDCMPRRDVFYEPRHLKQHIKHNTEVRGLACEVTPLYTTPQQRKPIDLSIIRKWPEGFEPRLQHVWLDVVSFIPNVKLYDLQRVLAEYGFEMQIYEATNSITASEAEDSQQRSKT